MVAAPRSLFCQSHKRPKCFAPKFRSLVHNPVVVTRRKEIPGIEVHGKLEITGRHGIAKPQHVDLARPSRNPSHSLTVDLDELIDVWRSVTQVMEQLSEVGARLTFVRVGPKLERES
jgi:hypothetical protein